MNILLEWPTFFILTKIHQVNWQEIDNCVFTQTQQMRGPNACKKRSIKDNKQKIWPNERTKSRWSGSARTHIEN